MSGPVERERRSVLIRLIDGYQRAYEGRPSPCRFTPSCSTYAREALELHGRGRGLWLTIRRLARCRPFGPSGFDPVPLPGEPSHRRRRAHTADVPVSPCCAAPYREGPMSQ
jgi:putative membrane protein insertion efficiency factor